MYVLRKKPISGVVRGLHHYSPNEVLSNPALKTAATALKNASFAQVYFDIALPTTAGQALDTATANFFAGKASAASVGNSVKASSGH